VSLASLVASDSVCIAYSNMANTHAMHDGTAEASQP
jgi:hypothetical protein